MGEQRYATKQFSSKKSAEGFKKKVGSSFTVKEKVKGVFSVRFKIDKTIPPKPKKDWYGEWYGERATDGSFAYNNSADDL